MRKKIIQPTTPQAAVPDAAWLALETLISVELTSEDPAHPIEGALQADGAGWRAAGPGEQVIRLVFDEPQRIGRIWLRFDEPAAARTQEFALRWSGDNGETFEQIVRQQWNFSPDGAATEEEDYSVELASVTTLELAITPDIGGGGAIASLAALRLA